MSPAVATRPQAVQSAPTRFRSDAAPDRFMRRLLGVQDVDLREGAGAHRAFRASVLVSAVRCLVSYVLVPLLVPLLHLAGWIATPVGLLLCAVAAVNGVVSMRRFWRADHRHRWTYTGFMTVIFAILALGLVTDVTRLGGIA